jgi:hypothetical protein
MGSAVIRKQVRDDRTAVMSPEQATEALEATYPESQRFLSHLKKSDQEKMTIALQVLALVREGKTLRAIAERMGFSHNTAAHYRDLALATIAIPLVEDYRKQELEIIGERIERLTARANNGDDKAEDQLRKYLEHRSRLTGTQKPTQVQASVHHSRADQEVASLLDGLIEGEVVDDLPTNEAPDIAEILSGPVIE